jgi:hypothetical protein
MAGLVPPSSMHSISSAVMSARPARSATLRPSATLVADGLTEGQGLADGDPFGILGLFRRPDQRVW